MKRYRLKKDYPLNALTEGTGLIIEKGSTISLESNDLLVHESFEEIKEEYCDTCERMVRPERIFIKNNETNQCLDCFSGQPKELPSEWIIEKIDGTLKCRNAMVGRLPEVEFAFSPFEIALLAFLDEHFKW